MPRFLNSLHGIVWSIHEDEMKILLPRGGKIRAPKKAGIHVGDHVAFLMDASNKHVTEVMLKEEADIIVKRGSNHILDSFCRHPPIIEEDEPDGNYDYEDETILWCPELS